MPYDLYQNCLDKFLLISISNVAGIHGARYEAWQCDPSGGDQGQIAKSSNYLRYLKPENSCFWTGLYEFV